MPIKLNLDWDHWTAELAQYKDQRVLIQMYLMDTHEWNLTLGIANSSGVWDGENLITHSHGIVTLIGGYAPRSLFYTRILPADPLQVGNDEDFTQYRQYCPAWDDQWEMLDQVIVMIPRSPIAHLSLNRIVKEFGLSYHWGTDHCFYIRIFDLKANIRAYCNLFADVEIIDGL